MPGQSRARLSDICLGMPGPRRLGAALLLAQVLSLLIATMGKPLLSSLDHLASHFQRSRNYVTQAHALPTLWNRFTYLSIFAWPNLKELCISPLSAGRLPAHHAAGDQLRRPGPGLLGCAAVSEAKTKGGLVQGRRAGSAGRGSQHLPCARIPLHLTDQRHPAGLLQRARCLTYLSGG